MDLRTDAEREYLRAIALEPRSTSGWFLLSVLYKDEGRIPDSIRALWRAIDLSPTPQPRELVKLASLYLDNQQPTLALGVFEEAVHCAPPDLLAETGPHSFRYGVAMGRAAAWRSIGDTKRAAAFEEEAVRDLLPKD